MRADAFDYELPEELIAQEPAPRRDESRLMVLRIDGPVPPTPRHRRFADLPTILEAGDLLVLNDARVLPARLSARRPTGGKVELLLLEPVGEVDPGPGSGGPAMRSAGRDPDRGSTASAGRRACGAGRQVWRALARPARRVRPGESLRVGGEGGVELSVVAVGEGGERSVAFPAGVDVDALLERHGAMPLPPYIDAPPTGNRDRLDRRRYQTVYARQPGAVAAPTAGLHFTPALLDALRERGVGVVTLTLHVGPGTFRPVTVEHVEDHAMESERYSIPAATADAVRAARERGGRVVAVGTTCVRTLEHSAIRSADGSVEAGEGRADLFIRPGHRFRVVDAMLTNFHLPRSTPVLLVSALVGRESLLAAYREAIREGYRFYSYGDAMLLLP